MEFKSSKVAAWGLLTAAFMASNLATAGIVKVSDTDFNSGAGQITFSEFALNTVNPFYTSANYGGDAGDPDVSFAGWFNGQMLSLDPTTDCPGAAATACIVGTPSGSLSLDVSSTDTFIVNDGSNPTSPVLSGSPIFNGGIAVLFSTDQFGVGFDGGFFNAIGSTAITAFARDGSLIGSVINTIEGIEFLGLVTDDATPAIAGVFLDLVGEEPAGFAIDNIRFGDVDDVLVTEVPEPSSIILLLSTLVGCGLIKRRK